ncbi:MAG: septum formation initiator family protein [Alphaproteobacteria bacterium]|nr:septum formation initiator family protein [Alphaproteobacteria bacterium]
MSKLNDIFLKMKSSSGFLFMMILLFVYFSVYAVKGERGLIRYVYLNKEVAEAKSMSKKYADEKHYWDEKVELLSSNLDLDLLDEQVRTVLNMVGPNEFVILDEKLKD